MKLIISILLLSAMLISGCSLFQSSAEYLIDNIEITWKPDKAKETTPVDSIVVKFDPVYWVEAPCEDGTEEETELEFTKSGYGVWMLDNPYAKRYEVIRKDTVIYFYKAK
ncbi:MAG: hypothetical protein M9949_06205 [Candidatus Kapabacteria bacterium]|nr:hypothetical protein [Candidatus Kapabacteria bacterium]